MELTHVCVWDPKVGYRRVSINEACVLHPYGISAKSGHFVCELCAANVLLTAPGVYAQHFRHDPSSPNKECDERQSSFDKNYGRSFVGLSSHIMPFRIQVTTSSFTLQLGFFFPPDARARCDKIKIASDNHQVFEYSFERIDRIGTTYLDVGGFPSRVYGIEYVNADQQLRNYWPTKITGIDAAGSFFDVRTGHILPPGGKAYAGKNYYFLTRSPVYSNIRDIESAEISRVCDQNYTTWYLYRIHIKSFSRFSAQFFLRHSIFLTERPTKFYPIWPAYVNDPYFIYYNASTFYYYLCGDDAELKAYPSAANPLITDGGRLYKLFSQEKTQLISLGKAGALGFSYLIRQPLNKKASLPIIKIFDQDDNELSDNTYTQLPKSKTISVLPQFDGRAVILKKGKIEYISRLTAGEIAVIDSISLDTEIQFYQGCDCVRLLRFERARGDCNIAVLDHALVRKLQSCSGPKIPVSHAIGTLRMRFESYPKTIAWLRSAIRQNELPRDAYQLLLNHSSFQRK